MTLQIDISQVQTIHQAFEAYAEKAPHHIAVIDGNLSYSYGELNQKANQLAHYIRQLGVKQDSIISIALDRSVQFVVGMLATLKAGCAYLPLEVEHPSQRLQYMLTDTQTPVLITLAKSKAKFLDYIGQIILMDGDSQEINTLSEHNPLCFAKDKNLAYLIYTSGSTGKPKGVLIEHKSIVNYQKWFQNYSDCKSQDRIDLSSSVIFDMAITNTITALALGLQIVICSDNVKKDPLQFLNHLQKNKINIIKLTPSYFKVLIQAAKLHSILLPDLQTIILGGEILYTRDCREWLELYPQHILINEYGPTETTVAVTQFKLTNVNINELGPIVPIGKPGFNIECQLFNEEKLATSPGDLGELFIGGICLARGYLNLKELTDKQFVNDSLAQNSYRKFYKTGDLCRYLPDGNLEYIKRLDDQIKIRGYRIELGEIEGCLATHFQIKDVHVIAREIHADEKQLIAYFIPQDIITCPTNKELKQFLQQRLSEYMIPAFFVSVKLFPLTENGKLDKSALPEPAYDEILAEPENEIEEKLVEIWQKEFQIKKLSAMAHFFEIGGHSLIAARIIINVEKFFGKRIRLEDIYKAPTIRQLAQSILAAEACAVETLPKKMTFNYSDNIPLSDFQFLFWISSLFEPKVKKLNIIGRKRISGKLDLKGIASALQKVVEKHDVLSYQIGKIFPLQYRKKNIEYKVFENDLTAFSNEDAELKLIESLDSLLLLKKWKKNKPQIILKLFHLNKEMTEVQVCIPHIVFDDTSIDVLFSELSFAYLNYKNNICESYNNEDTSYKSFVIEERGSLNQFLDRDIAFWREYFKDATMLKLPDNVIMHNMHKTKYSSYFELPAAVVNDLHILCKNGSVSITDILCAALGITFKKSAEHLNNHIIINIIRSMRENDTHDKMIGCFLRLDPVKVSLNNNLNLIEFAQLIQQERIHTDIYQACSGMVKMACLNKDYNKNFILNSLIKFVFKTYCTLFPKLKLNPNMLLMYKHVSPLRTKNQFIVNINLFNNFFSANSEDTLFGEKIVKTKIHEYDFSSIDNVIDVSLFKDLGLNKAYLVISGNLSESYRQQIGNEIVNLIIS